MANGWLTIADVYRPQQAADVANIANAAVGLQANRAALADTQAKTDAMTQAYGSPAAYYAQLMKNQQDATAQAQETAQQTLAVNRFQVFHGMLKDAEASGDSAQAQVIVNAMKADPHVSKLVPPGYDFKVTGKNSTVTQFQNVTAEQLKGIADHIAPTAPEVAQEIRNIPVGSNIQLSHGADGSYKVESAPYQPKLEKITQGEKGVIIGPDGKPQVVIEGEPKPKTAAEMEQDYIDSLQKEKGMSKTKAYEKAKTLGASAREEYTATHLTLNERLAKIDSLNKQADSLRKASVSIHNPTSAAAQGQAFADLPGIDAKTYANLVGAYGDPKRRQQAVDEADTHIQKRLAEIEAERTNLRKGLPPSMQTKTSDTQSKQYPQAPADPKQRQVGQIYSSPKGNFKWMGNGWSPVP